MAATDLTTLANVKPWLTQDQVITADDALLTRLITASSEFVTSWLGVNIKSTDYTEYRNGNNQPSLMLYNHPVTAVASVSVDGVPAVPAVTGVGTPGYVFDAELLYMRGGVFPRGYQNVIVTYTAGYVLVPPDIEQACIELVTLRYRERGREGQASKNIGNGQVVAFSSKDMAPSTRTALMSYRKTSGIW